MLAVERTQGPSNSSRRLSTFFRKVATARNIREPSYVGLAFAGMTAMLIVYAVIAAFVANVAVWAVWTVGAAESRVASAGPPPFVIEHHLQRHLKGDRLNQKDTDPPGEVASIEVWGPTHQIVLRGHEGEVALWVDPANATTVVTKGVSIPQLTLQSTASPETIKPRWLSVVLASVGY